MHYVGVSVSFIDNWTLWAVSLSIQPITKAHTAVNIKDEVTRVLDSFDIIPQCFVADNASNQVCLFSGRVVLLISRCSATIS